MADSTIYSSGLSQKSAKVSLLTVGAALVFASVCMIFFQFLSLRESVVEDLTVQAKIIAENSSAAILFQDAKACEETLGSLRASPSVESATVFDKNNTLLAQYRRTSASRLASPSVNLLAQAYSFQKRYVDVAQPVRSNGSVIGTVILRADLYEMYKQLLTSVLITISILAGSLGVAYLLVWRMRRALSAAETHLTYLAHVDSVTGLPNRHAFNERLNFAITKLKRFGGSVDLLLLDLDNFKVVNDTLGHQSGDQLLKLVAQRLIGALRDTDTICRIGGDEFAIILESKEVSKKGSAVAEKVIDALATPFSVEQSDLYVTVSIGISSCPGDGDDMPQLIRNADTAMYQAKRQGKNTFSLFNPQLDHAAQKRLLIESRLRKALEREELSLHYQPKLRLEDDSIIGFEALLRWNDPEFGSIGPAEFIPVAEESGLMLPIGAWVLKTACRDIAAWRQLGLGNINVAVNLSVRQTKDAHLLDEVLAALRQYDVKPAQLELEITESILMEHIESNIELLEKIRSSGIRLSIDDFGTGYSSLAYLKRFRIDELKIDRAFIKDIPDNGEDEAIVTAIVALAHSLGLSTVAEGVETKQQLDFLRFVKCDCIQGYYISKPVPFDDVLNLLKRSSGNVAILEAN
jgi:diguanylate cyclase